LTLARIGSLGPGFLGIQNVITEDVEVALSESDEVRLRAVIAAAGSACPQLKVNWGSRSSGLKRCVSPFLTPFVTIQGHLTPCCALVDSTPFRETSLLGTENWDEIRSSENVMKWMRDYLVEDPEPCRGCTFNPARTEKTRQRTSL
jgi:hypothetical protein